MDAETMANEEMDALAKRLYGARMKGGNVWIAVAREATRWADERAALRAQAKAEPVARLISYKGRDTYPGQGYTVARTYDEFPENSTPGLWAEGSKLYTAPPPDHAEALAEALEEIMSYEGGAESPLEDQYVVDRAQSALTRYKESRNV
jgi:hypothetical protein